MGRNVPWEVALVASLSEAKRSGYSFTVGWQLAIRANPPRSKVEKAIVEDVREFCEDAWMGRKTALRHFSLEMLREPDGTSEARSSGSFRVDSLVAA